MKFFYLTVIVFLSSVSISNAQDYKEAINNEFNEYLNSLLDQEFEKSTDYIYPKFYEIFPKSFMIKTMESVFNNPDMTFEITNSKVLNIENYKKIDSVYYSLLQYSNDMDIQFPSEKEETEDEKQLRLSLTLISLETSFGENNVTYSEEFDTYNIHSEKKAIAISNTGLYDWKFLVLEEKQKPILKKLIPSELLNQVWPE